MLVSHAINLVSLKQVGSFIVGLLYLYFFFTISCKFFLLCYFWSRIRANLV